METTEKKEEWKKKRVERVSCWQLKAGVATDCKDSSLLPVTSGNDSTSLALKRHLLTCTAREKYEVEVVLKIFCLYWASITALQKSAICPVQHSTACVNMEKDTDVCSGKVGFEPSVNKEEERLLRRFKTRDGAPVSKQQAASPPVIGLHVWFENFPCRLGFPLPG